MFFDFPILFMIEVIFIHFKNVIISEGLMILNNSIVRKR